MYEALSLIPSIAKNKTWEKRQKGDINFPFCKTYKVCLEPWWLTSLVPVFTGGGNWIPVFEASLLYVLRPWLK